VEEGRKEGRKWRKELRKEQLQVIEGRTDGWKKVEEGIKEGKLLLQVIEGRTDGRKEGRKESCCCR
jgi:hypothetical protein